MEFYNSATGWVCAVLPIHICARVNHGSKVQYETKKTELEWPKNRV